MMKLSPGLQNKIYEQLWPKHREQLDWESKTVAKPFRAGCGLVGLKAGVSNHRGTSG